MTETFSSSVSSHLGLGSIAYQSEGFLDVGMNNGRFVCIFSFRIEGTRRKNRITEANRKLDVVVQVLPGNGNCSIGGHQGRKCG